MATFDTLESSVQDSRPLEVFEVTIGSQTFRWTSAEDDQVVSANTYSAIPIRRTNISVDPSNRRDTLTLTVPGDNAFAVQYLNQAPTQRAFVKVTRLQRDESPTFTTKLAIYRGFVQTVRFPNDGVTAEIVCQTFEAVGQQQTPKFMFLGMCNNILGDGNCGVDLSLFNVTGTATAVSGNTVTVTGLNAKPDGYFDGGYATPVANSDPRLILKHVGNVLTLLLPFATDVTGTSVQAFAGCNHVLSGDCETKFDNGLRFGGFAFSPKLNPFSTNPWSLGV